MYKKISHCFLAILFICNAKTQFLKQPSQISTPLLVEDAGYNLEDHKVTTTDGYVLTLYRIPPTSSNVAESDEIPTQQRSPPRVVFLMHGFQRSSIDFVLHGPVKSLAFFLANAGYDVWLGNARGTRYSQTHTTKRTSSSDYWDFSWHEIGVYDLPAFIDYIVATTGAPQVHFVGHSQGTTEFKVAASMLPQFNERIKSAHLLGGALKYDHSFTVRNVLLLEPALKLVVGLFGNFDLGSGTNRAYENFINRICKNGSLLQSICAGRLLFAAGKSPYTNRTLLPLITNTETSGASSKQALHLMQIARTGRFRQFDYGLLQNLAHYQSLQPPDYNIQAISAPTYVYYCDNDAIADIKDVEQMISVWPKQSLKGATLVPFPGCNHVDFMFGINVTDYINNELLNNMNSYENSNLIPEIFVRSST